MKQGITRRAVLGAIAAPAIAGITRGARAYAQEPLKIGILNDTTGLTAEISGVGSWASADMALEDFGGSVLGRPIELLKGNHQAKADIGITLARKWYDEGVRAIFDVGITTVAIGVQQLARDKNRIVVFNSTGTADITGKLCSPNGIHWTFDSHYLGVVTARANMATGMKTWFFMTADYVYGKSLQAEATEYITAHGGSVIGQAYHAFETTDFASDILKAQSSGAQLIGLATPTIQIGDIIKQASEFGLAQDKSKRLAPIGLFLNDVKGIGLPLTQGLLVTEPFYWDQDDATRAFSKRYFAKVGKMPNGIQASVYGAVMHYLNAVKAANSDRTDVVLKAMRDTPVNDFMTRNGEIRADGRLVRDVYVFRVKSPDESKGEWDLYALVSTVPGKEAFKPADPAVCNIVK